MLCPPDKRSPQFILLLQEKEKIGRKGLGLPFYRVAAMLLAGCCAFRRKGTYSGIALTRKMTAMSQQPGEEAQPRLEPTMSLHQAPAVSMERGAEISTSKGLKQGLVAPRPRPPLCPSLIRAGCTAFPRKVGRNFAWESTSSQVFCGRHRAEGKVGAKHMAGLSRWQRYGVGSWCKGWEHLGLPTDKPCSRKHQGKSKTTPQLDKVLTQFITVWFLLAII